MGIEHRYDYTIIENLTDKEKVKELKGYELIAQSRIYFDGVGNFVISNEASTGLATLMKMGGKKDEEINKIFKNTLMKGADELCNELKECFSKAFDEAVKEVLGEIFND